MKREFLLNLLFLLAINLLIKPFYIFGIDRNVQNLVGASEFGLYYGLLNITYLVQIISDFGLQNFNNRYISQHRQLIGKYFPVMLGLKLLLCAVYLLLTIGFGILMGYSTALFLLFALTLNQIFVTLILFFRSSISGLGLYRMDSFLSVADKLLLILLMLVLLYHPTFRPYFKMTWFVGAQLVSTFSVLLLAMLLLWRSNIGMLKWSFKRSQLLYFLKKSLPYATIVLLMTLYTRIDVLMLDQLLPDGNFHVGVYAAAYRLLDASNMIGYLFASLLLPMFSRMIKTKAPVSDLLESSFRLLIFGSIVLASTICVFRQPIVERMYDHATPYWGDVLGILIWSFVPVSITYIFGALLTANENIQKMNRIFAFGIGLNVVLNLVLIHRFQAVGTAMSTLITQTVVTSFLAVLLFRELQIHWQLPVWKLVLFVLLAVAIPIMVVHLTSLGWEFQMGISLVATTVVGVVLQFLPIQSFLTLLVKKGD